MIPPITYYTKVFLLSTFFKNAVNKQIKKKALFYQELF
ncbi:hypothetical protein SAG0030_02410 [Streptococcus agalactiae FSL S3-603]|nr:hypothetical protein SAG0030_02410 [Streptococcus agalactiae FSL S3-603]